MSIFANSGAFWTLVALPLALILGILILSMGRSALRANASKRWPSTDGKIVVSSVDSHRSHSSSSHTTTTMYRPRVVYDYSVDGSRYQSQQISFGPVSSTSSSGWAEKIAEKYPRGADVQVFYNPSRPGDAVLEHSGSVGNILLLIVLVPIELVLILFALSGLIGQVR